MLTLTRVARPVSVSVSVSRTAGHAHAHANRNSLLQHVLRQILVLEQPLQPIPDIGPCDGNGLFA